jgi:hypothetical protein
LESDSTARTSPANQKRRFGSGVTRNIRRSHITDWPDSISTKRRIPGESNRFCLHLQVLVSGKWSVMYGKCTLWSWEQVIRFEAWIIIDTSVKRRQINSQCIIHCVVKGNAFIKTMSSNEACMAKKKAEIISQFCKPKSSRTGGEWVVNVSEFLINLL